jgi:hypothetical protein
VTVEVEDLRSPRTPDSEKLTQLIRDTIVKALKTGAQNREERLRVHVALQHDASFSLGFWTAQTALKATIFRGGQQVSEWTSVGEGKRWNALPGLLEPQFATNTAFQTAMDDLMARLVAGPKF